MRLLTKEEHGINTVEEYHAYPALSSSKLSAYKKCPAESLREIKPKSAFEIGNMFELRVESLVKSDPDIFLAKYPLEESLVGKMPEKLPERYELFLKDPENEPLEQYIRIKKDGNPYAGSEESNLWYETYAKANGKHPISVEIYADITKMALNTLNIELFGMKLIDLWKYAKFQVPVVWEKDGIIKKALYDVIVDIKTSGGFIKRLHFDLKSSANVHTVISMFRSKYWVQDRHYTEGVQASLLEESSIDMNDRMMFVVCETAKPDNDVCYARPVQVGNEGESFDMLNLAYEQLCNDYFIWQSQGKEPIAWNNEIEEIRVFI